jgi:hypothetical protein
MNRRGAIGYSVRLAIFQRRTDGLNEQIIGVNEQIPGRGESDAVEISGTKNPEGPRI